ncbi:MAG: hypothetical protein J6C41_01085 [Oscillospiraceae bacterium]|nr:hypothetical protein [Oscillospiraceae bacterium]
MKKKLYLLLALLLLAAVIVVGVLFFVNRESREQAAVAPEAPVTRLAEDLSVHWDQVESAESYIINVNGNDLYSTENTSFSVLSVPGTYKIQVQAVNKAGKSDYSNEVTYQTLGVTVPESDLYTVLGNPVVGYGMDYTFTLEIAEGCTKCEPVVEVNGQVVTPDAGGNYTAADVTEDLTVTVKGVELNSYPVSLPAGTGYTLSGEPVAYYGKDYTFTLTLKEGYGKSQPVVKANGVELAPRNGSYVIPNVTKPQEITVSGVAINTYTVNFTTGRGYRISPSGAQTVLHGERVQFAVTADSPSYKLTVMADGKKLSAENGVYTISNITSDVQVTVKVSGLPALTGAQKILDAASWGTASAAYEGNGLTVSANSVLKAAYFKDLWDAGYTHLVFTVNAKAAADNNTNFTHGGEWTRYWANFEPGKNVDLRIDLNEFHNGNTWFDLKFNAGAMTVSNPRAYRSAETLSWVKDNSTTYFAIEDGYYVLETRGNDFGVTSPTQWLQKYVVEDEAGQRTWLVYTDYIKQGDNTRSVIWGWGSPVSTMNIGQWMAINNVQIDGYQPGEVFSLVLDRAGVARFKISNFISNRNTWGTFSFSKVSEDSITFSGAVDQKLRFFPTDELIASGYTHLQVTFSGHIGDSVIYFGNDEWGAEKYIIGVSKNELTMANDYTYTANVDLSRMNGNLFTLLVAGAPVTDMTVTVRPMVLSTYNVTLPSGEGYTVSGEATAVSGSSYRFTLMLSEGYTKSKALVKVNGLELINGTGGVYTVENVQEDLVVTVENIVRNTYTVTKPESEDYTVSGADSVAHGESYSFTVTANDPTIPLVVLVNGSVTVGTDGVYTVANVTEDLVITVQATLPDPVSPKDILSGDSWTGITLSSSSNSLMKAANASLKGAAMKELWDAGYTHLVFTVNAKAAADNNTNFTHSGTWSRFWETFQAGTNVDIRIDLNEFHDGDTWYDVNFNAGSMVISNPRAYKSAETLSWTKSNTNVYFAIENGYYVLETRGNDFGVISSTQWLKKYVVKDDADQRTWLMYTDYITKGSNTRSMIWGWGSPVNTIIGDVNGGWAWNNNVSNDRQVFSLHLDRAGVARFKMLDWVSNRNGWNSALTITYVDEQTIRWSAASDYKLRLATTQDLIAQGYTTLKVTLTGNLGSAKIWYGDDDWSDGEIAVNAKNFVNGSYTFEVDLTTFKPNENFTLMASAAAFTNLTVRIEPLME